MPWLLIGEVRLMGWLQGEGGREQGVKQKLIPHDRRSEGRLLLGPLRLASRGGRGRGMHEGSRRPGGRGREVGGTCRCDGGRGFATSGLPGRLHSHSGRENVVGGLWVLSL